MSAAIPVFSGRDALWVFKKFRISIDEKNDLVVFENCVRPRSFFNLIPLKRVECRCSEIYKVATHSVDKTRCVKLAIAAGDVALNEEELSDFDEFVALFRELENPSVCPPEIAKPKTDYVLHAVFGAIFAALVVLVVGVFMGWFW